MKVSKHTILVTVAPSGAGKSFWCENYGLPKLSAIFDKVHYISSDEIRRLCLGENAHKYSRDMWAVSSNAFDLLYQELDSVIRYPANKDVVVVDSTGLSKDFRSKIEDIAWRNCYQVQYLIFDYDNVEDYYSDGPSEITDRHVKNLQKQLKYFNNTKSYHVKSLQDFDFDIQQHGPQARYLNLCDPNYCIIGDVHSCYEELVELVNKARDKGFRKIILVGDLFDKGPQENGKKVLKFIDESNDILVIRGNHDHYALHHWRSEPDHHAPQEVLEEHFDGVISADDEFKQLATKIYNEGFDWIDTRDAYISHSPCLNKYLYKSFPHAIKAQRNFRHRLDEGQTIQEKLYWLYEQDNRYHKYHVSGHISLAQPFIGKSQIMIDTGCVYGNKLTALYFSEGQPRFISVDAKRAYRQDILPTL